MLDQIKKNRPLDFSLQNHDCHMCKQLFSSPPKLLVFTKTSNEGIELLRLTKTRSDKNERIYSYVFIIYTTCWCHCLWGLHNRIRDSRAFSQCADGCGGLSFPPCENNHVTAGLGTVPHKHTWTEVAHDCYRGCSHQVSVPGAMRPAWCLRRESPVKTLPRRSQLAASDMALLKYTFIALSRKRTEKSWRLFRSWKYHGGGHFHRWSICFFHRDNRSVSTVERFNMSSGVKGECKHTRELFLWQNVRR